MKTVLNPGRRLCLSFPLGVALAFSLNLSLAQDWALTSVPHDAWNSGWDALAMSADARKMLVAGGFVHCFFGCAYVPLPIYISADYGVTWAQAGAPSNYWSAVASSADGDTLVAAATLTLDDSNALQGDGLIYTSRDSGGTWSQTTAPSNFWSCVASSADGAKLIAAAVRSDVNGSPGSIYASTNFGATWFQTAAPSNYWTTTACSADGNRVTAGSVLYSPRGNRGSGLIYRSNDGGATWVMTGAPSNNWVSLATSADGTRLIAAPGGFNVFDLIYISTNSGQTWQPASLPTNNWTCVASSAEGRTLVASASKAIPLFGVQGGDGLIYTSFDSGASWTANNVPASTWRTAGSSADGIKLAAASRDSAPGYEAGATYVGSCTVQVDLPPKLTIAPSGKDIEVSWLVPSRVHVLEANADLTASGWAFVQTMPMLDLATLHYKFTVNALQGGSHFYRLRPEP